MVNESNAKQFEGFDFNDYVFCDTSAWQWNGVAAPNNIQIYIAGTQANAATLAAALAAIPQPAAGGPPTSIGPQYPWPFNGTAGGPPALPAFVVNGLTNFINIPPVQRTLFRVVTNDMYVYLLNAKMAGMLYTWLLANPAFAALGPGTFAVPTWLLPVPVFLQADVGLYEFERKWIWLLFVRAVADADADLHVYMEG